jgi:hypothetical protein
MRVDAELFDICKEFIKEYRIKSPEDLDDLDDHLLYELVEQICDLIGYYDVEEDLEDIED